jgi:hypothetical protein
MKLLSPLKAIRKKCVECSGGSFKEVRECKHNDCSLFNNRMGKGRGRYLKLIRKYCLWCCIGSSKEVQLCPCTDCFLYSFRFGKNPNRSGRGWEKNLMSKKVGSDVSVEEKLEKSPTEDTSNLIRKAN